LIDVPFIYKCYGKCLNDFNGYHAFNEHGFRIEELYLVPLYKEEPKKEKIDISRVCLYNKLQNMC
jgi:hypothetical protein